MFADRLTRLQSALQERGIDWLALLPGPNLRYLTGLDFHLSERPLVMFVPPEGAPVLALPSLELPKFRRLGPFEAETFTYEDVDGPESAFMSAVAALPEAYRIAVEHLRMRVLEFNLIRRRVPNVIVVDAGPLMDILRLYKDEAEVAQQRAAVRMTEDALAAVAEEIQPGMTEHQIAGMLRIALIEQGGGEAAFSPIVLSGPNAALPHGGPGERAVAAGEVLLIDFGTTSGGYVADLTRTFAVGRALEGRDRDVYEAVRAANAAGRAAAKPGVAAGEVDRAARQVMIDAGFGDAFIHRTGHGIGLEVHEGPYIVPGGETTLEPGMTFTVEPGAYLPGEIGVRIEDDMLVTPEGAESMTRYPREMTVLGG
jgi:Xaa-Pro dipeptidase